MGRITMLRERKPRYKFVTNPTGRER
jgi:hypothetical protein